MRPHILIVEDDPATRESLSLMLNAEGYVVDEATDGNAALARSRSGLPPRLVILDLQMTGMDGWQFLCARQREPALAAVPVLVLTAARGIDGPELRALGAKEVLEKPAATEDVVAAVRHYCPAATGLPEPARESLVCAAPHGHEDHPRARPRVARPHPPPPRRARLVLLGPACLALGLLTVVFGFPGLVGLPLSLTAMRLYARRLRKAPSGFAGLDGKVAAQRGERTARLGAALSFGGLVGWGIAALLYFLT
jgi:CheY-like chemotaxis protein